MADGHGRRWGRYLGRPKHLIRLGGESLLERTVRLLKANGVDGIAISSVSVGMSQGGRYAASRRGATVRDTGEFEATRWLL